MPKYKLRVCPTCKLKMVNLERYGVCRMCNNTAPRERSLFERLFKKYDIQLEREIAELDRRIVGVADFDYLKANNHKFAVALSGGTDSGLLTCLIKPPYAVTCHLPYGKRYDEFNDARRTFKHSGAGKHLIVDTDPKDFDKTMKIAVRLLGRPVPHFSVYPMYLMFERLAKEGIDVLIVGDGPDETMNGYVRHIMLDYVYNFKHIDEFEQYEPLHQKMLYPAYEAYSRMIDKPKREIKPFFDEAESILCACSLTDMKLVRDDILLMENSFAKKFGIVVFRPYQELDDYMLNLPHDLKVNDFWGKWLERKVAEKYVPKEVVWRRQKMGGPVFPVNIIKGWDKKVGEFGKSLYLEWQERLLG